MRGNGTMLQTHVAAVNGITLHYAEAGQGTPLIFLHGFPACWYVWKPHLEALQHTFRVIAPDGRGVNRSAKPFAVAEYALETLAADIVALADHLKLPTFGLVGHDWGGALAWKIAQLYPQRVTRVLILNAPPLEAFLFALATMPEQQAASSYIARLKADHAATTLLADNGAALWQATFADYLANGTYTAADQAYYQQAWQIPNALHCFLHWYRANVPNFDLLDAQHYIPAMIPPITVPSLLLWGESEQAFTPSLLAIIPDYVAHLAIIRITAADHWIMLDQPAQFQTLLQTFFQST
jgi:pimeloyl-ACP methyl ester carboxylesterase